MKDDHADRRLVAILAADVVGYSRMMSTDEATALAALKHHRLSVFDPTIAGHNGRVVKLIGDGTLVQFGSVVDAVNCALALQRGQVDGVDPSFPEIVLRIGINIGDVRVDGDDIYGDGVNVAARLEPLADPVVSASPQSLKKALSAASTFCSRTGRGSVEEHRPPHPYLEMASSIVTSDAIRRSARRALDSLRPSLAVLPFQNMSGDVEQEYFADGVVEDIITALSRFRSFAVIARNSSFVYKGRSTDVRQVAHELGVRYVLEGSIRRAALGCVSPHNSSRVLPARISGPSTMMDRPRNF